MKNLLLIPIGDIDSVTIAGIARALENTFPFKVSIGKTAGIPGRAFNRRRKQYHSTVILEELLRYKREAGIVLGIAVSTSMCHNSTLSLVRPIS